MAVIVTPVLETRAVSPDVEAPLRESGLSRITVTCCGAEAVMGSALVTPDTVKTLERVHAWAGC